MRAVRTIWHDQLFFILLGVSLVCFGLTRLLHVHFFALPATVLVAPRTLLGELSGTVSTLRRENRRLAELVARQELDNAFWRNQARIGESLSSRYRFERAVVVGRDPQSQVRTLIVDRGLLNNVHSQMAAVTEAGVAGKVVEAGANVAFVATLHNPRFKAAVLDARSRVVGVVSPAPGWQTPREAGLMSMDYVLPEMDILLGDTIITSGTGGVFPKGLRIGTVVRVDTAPKGLFRRIDVRPAVNIAAVEYLYLIRPVDWDVVQRRQQEAVEEMKRKQQAELRRLLESSRLEVTGEVGQENE